MEIRGKFSGWRTVEVRNSVAQNNAAKNSAADNSAADNSAAKNSAAKNSAADNYICITSPYAAAAAPDFNNNYGFILYIIKYQCIVKFILPFWVAQR